MPLRWLLSPLCLLLGALGSQGCQRCDRDDGQLALLYLVDATRPESGDLTVELRVRNLPAGQHVFIRGGNPDTTVVREVTARAGDRPVDVSRTGGRGDAWSLSLDAAGGQRQQVTLRWRARQGGLSRHGHEGYLGRHFALIDGGVFLLPKAARDSELSGWRGRSSVSRIRVQVRARPGWEAISTMDAVAGPESTPPTFDPQVRGRWAVDHLAHCNIALGQFDLVERRIGALQARVYLYRGWPAKKKQQIASGALQVLAVFARQAPCRDLPSYTTIFLPAAADRQPVSGQFWSTGQAFSYDAYVEEGRPRRVWELYAHRLAHAVNRYSICGMHIDDEKERWFTEGWASWTEVTHPLQARVIGSEQRLVELGKAYRAVLFGLDDRVRDAPVFHEATRSYKQLTLYLHYTKAPLLVQQLDHELRRRSNGRKSVNGFIAAVYPRYGGHRASLPLKLELERYLGGSLDAFFADHVERSGFLYPVHEEFIAHLRQLERPAAERAPALEVDGRTLDGGQVRDLQRLLGLLGVSGAEAVRERLVALLLVAAEYERRELRAVPQVMVELTDRLPASVRWLMFRHQQAALFGDDRAPYDRWLAERRRSASVRWLAASPP